MEVLVLTLAVAAVILAVVLAVLTAGLGAARAEAETAAEAAAAVMEAVADLRLRLEVLETAVTTLTARPVGPAIQDKETSLGPILDIHRTGPSQAKEGKP